MPMSKVVYSSFLPRWSVLLIDICLVMAAYTISYAIGNNIFQYHPMDMALEVWQQGCLVVAVQALCFLFFRIPSGILRFSTFMDAIKMSMSVVIATMLLLAVNFVGRLADVQLFLTTVIIVYFFVAIVLLLTLRVAVKTMFEYVSHHAPSVQKAMIYGAQYAGLSIAKMLLSDVDSLYRPVGFITEDSKTSHNLLGLKVYPLGDAVIQMMKKKGITCVIVSPNKMKSINPLTDLNIFFDNGIKVLTTPNFTDFAPDNDATPDMSPKIGAIESIRVEDLLERPAININTENVRQILDNKVVMITGAAGSIGSEIVRQISHYQPRLVVLVEVAESPLHDLTLDLHQEFPRVNYARRIADVRDEAMMRHTFAEYKPDVVFHAAAYKHVPLMEEFPAQAVLANVLGTKNVADMAVEFDVERFVMISTDKAVNPTNVMGASKRIAEMYVQALNNHIVTKGKGTKFITTRFGNVLGSNGSVVPYFKKQIAAGGPVTVTHPDIIRYFMTIPEAATLVLEAATLGNGGEIFCFDMGHPVKIADLARNMIRLSGYVPDQDIHIVYTGLRPGEKLYEELLNNKEITKPTPNEKIMIAQVREVEYASVSEQIAALIENAVTGKSFPTVAAMKAIVPEFKSKNSVFEKLD